MEAVRLGMQVAFGGGQRKTVKKHPSKNPTGGEKCPFIFRIHYSLEKLCL